MKLLSLVLICGVILAGCGGEKQADKPSVKIPSTAPGSSNPGAIKDEIKKTDIVIGKDKRVAENGDQVWMVYTGTVKNGTKPFDQNTDLVHPPYNFTLGQGMVIKGWDLGILGMHPGGKRKLEVPASLAYGSDTMNGIPPNSDLVFTVELAGLVKAGEEVVIDMETLKPGTGERKVKVGDKVEISYKGYLSNGKLVKESMTTFVVGKKELLPCIEKGVQGMKIGGERKITAPPLTAFANSEASGIPANSLMVFEVQLKAFK